MKKQEYIQNYNSNFKKNSSNILCLCGSSKAKKISNHDRYGFLSPTKVCLKCGLIYTNPRPSKKLINDFYENGSYRIFYESINPYEDLSKKLSIKDLENKYKFEYDNSKFIYKKLKKLITKKDNVLEIGMGGAWNLFNFPNKQRLYGVELDKSLCDLAIKKGIKNTLIGSFDKISNFKIKFKFIILNHVIEHLFNLKKDFNLINKYLLSDGYLYVGCPLYDHSHNYGEFQNVHNYYFTKNTLIHYLSKYNFDLIEWGEEDKINQYAIFKKNKKNKIFYYQKNLEIKKVINKLNEFQYLQDQKYKTRNLIKRILGNDITKIIKIILNFYRKIFICFKIKIYGENKIRKDRQKFKN